MTLFGKASLDKAHPWLANHKHGMAISPMLQSLYLQFCSEVVPRTACELLNRALDIDELTNDSQAYRLLHEHGSSTEVEQQLEIALQEEEHETSAALPKNPGEREVIYAMFDGGQFLYEDGYREVKIGRVFRASQLLGEAQVGDCEGVTPPGRVLNSEYIMREGHHENFTERYGNLLDDYMSRYPGAELVFVKDGADWMQKWTEQRYPDATRVLDFFHAYEYLCDFGVHAFDDATVRKRQLALWKDLLKEGQVDLLIEELTTYREDERARVREAVEKVLTYYTKRRDQMRYKEFREKGLLIGSGAIESAVKSVAQQRCKLSGQRWNDGLQPVLNIRSIYRSGKAKRVDRIILNQFQTAA